MEALFLRLLDFAWQSALRQQLRKEKALQGNIKNIHASRKKTTKKQTNFNTRTHAHTNTLIIQWRGLVARYATAACLSTLISCNDPQRSFVSKNVFSASIRCEPVHSPVCARVCLCVFLESVSTIALILLTDWRPQKLKAVWSQALISYRVTCRLFLSPLPPN